MKARPKPAIGHMPFEGHRTQAQVRLDELYMPPKVLTDKDRVKDAVNGSTKLRDAILRRAA
jgi:hypothetical protein